MKFTRQNYMNGDCSFRVYYAQFVTEVTKARVISAIGRECILSSECKHFNDIPLEKWDKLGLQFSGPLAEGVCIVKEAATQIRDEHNGL